LYEDDGISQDYLKDIYSKTKIICTTKSNGFDIHISPEDNGFRQSDNRNMVMVINTESKPESVLVDGKAVGLVDQRVMEASYEKDMKSISWSWDEEANKCVVKVPDARKGMSIVVKNILR
jgi:alpha-glucosidase